MHLENLKVTGMTCDDCSNKVAQALKAVPGVNEVTVSFQDGEANVQYDEVKCSPDQLKEAVKVAGFGVDPGNIAAGMTPKIC